MTGPAYGKISIPAEVFLIYPDGGVVNLNEASVYIHVKGYALARVTHLDVEDEALGKLLPQGGGKFLNIIGVADGLEIRMNGGLKVKVKSQILTEVLKLGEKTRTWVGGKTGGIYVGFKRPEVRKLEKIAKEKYAVKPR
ncbi:MAG: hypothetical protein N3E48_00510 [Candidatus Bathyarchaeota archaeon]|nr:hypothetical protein [Candidatus Bathyarchaeota archaeon]